MRFFSRIGIFTFACGALVQVIPAAAAQQTWVSAAGDDKGTCLRANPCRTFAFALTKTTNGGQINVLDSGSYGPVTINKNVSIVADDVEALINTAAGGAAIKVQAGGGIVSLRGLTIDVTGNDGIFFVSGAALHVHKCVIHRTEIGINFRPASGTGELYVSDSVIADPASSGIGVFPTGSASAKVMIDRVQVRNAFNTGISFSGGSTTGSIVAIVRDSVSSNGESSGIRATHSENGTTTVTVDRSVAANNAGGGIVALGANATIRIGDSTVTGNFEGLSAGGGVIESYGTNKVDGNDTDIEGTIGTATHR